jgi:hypothetical protein
MTDERTTLSDDEILTTPGDTRLRREDDSDQGDDDTDTSDADTDDTDSDADADDA